MIGGARVVVVRNTMMIGGIVSGRQTATGLHGLSVLGGVGGIVGQVLPGTQGRVVVVFSTGGGVVVVTMTGGGVVSAGTVTSKVGGAVVSTTGGAVGGVVAASVDLTDRGAMVVAGRRWGLRVVGTTVVTRARTVVGAAVIVVDTALVVVVVVVVLVVVVLVVVVVDVVVVVEVVAGTAVVDAGVVGGTVVGGTVGAAVVGGVGGRNDPVGFSRTSPTDSNTSPLTSAAVGTVRRRRIDRGKPLRCHR